MKFLSHCVLGLVCAQSLLFSCDKSEKSSLCFLATYVTQSHSVSYGYTGDTRLTTETMIVGPDTFVTTYLYSNLGIITVSARTGAGATYTTAYLYDGSNRLLTREEDRTDEIEKVTYTYNANGQVATVTTRIITATDTLITLDTYEYSDIATKNPATITTQTPTGDVYTTFLEYDNKINPLRGFLPSIQPYSNVIKRTVNGNIETIVYQYNSEGYPTAATSSTGKSESWTYSCKEV